MERLKNLVRPFYIFVRFTTPHKIFLWVNSLIILLHKKSLIFRKLDFKDDSLKIKVSSQVELNSRLFPCMLEPNTVNWLKTFQKDWVFFDIGANIGAYSLIAGSLHQNKNIKIYSFEPHTENFSSLCQNIRKNNLSSSICPVNLAFDQKTKLSTLYHWDSYEVGEAGSSGHQIDQTLDDKGKEFTPQHSSLALSMGLDDFCKSYNVWPSAIKIDVDGIEDKILSGSSHCLAHKNLQTLIIEMNKANEKKWKKLIESHGFVHKQTCENNNMIFSRS